MSGLLIRSACIELVESFSLAPVTNDLLRSLLMESDRAFLQSLYDLAAVAGHEHEAILRRGVAVAILHSTVHLGDDIEDGDVNDQDLIAMANARYGRQYDAREAEAMALAVACLQSLHNIASYAIHCCGIPEDSADQFFRLLGQVGCAQTQELVTDNWSLSSSQSAAIGLNGQLFSAYFSLLWFGTELQSSAMQIGHDFGVACHVAADIRSEDKRYHSLPESQQCELRTWAFDAWQRLMQLDEAHAAAPALHRYLKPLFSDLAY